MDAEQDRMINGLVFAMIDDGGIGNNVFEFAQDEGYDTAIKRVEAWQNAIEDMLEAGQVESHPINQVLLELKRRVGLYLTNLVIQRNNQCSE